jgi:hypothetical protein
VKLFVVYTAARFGVFLVVYGVLIGSYVLVAGTPIPVLWPLLVAAVLSTILSAYLLRDLRQRFAEQVQQRADRMSERFEEMRAKEDTD